MMKTLRARLSGDDRVVGRIMRLAVMIGAMALIGLQANAVVAANAAHDGDERGDEHHAAYTIGGTVTGLIGSGLTLSDNGTDDLAITRNGNFTFAKRLARRGGYSVAVRTQPNNPAQTCTVGLGIGRVHHQNITNLLVDCQSVSLTLTSSAPANGTTDALTTVSPVLTFSAALDASTVIPANVTLSGPGGKVPVQVSALGNTMTVSPTNALTANTPYTLTVAIAIRGSAGERLSSAVSVTFTTGAKWTSLIGRTTTLGAQEEAYECTRFVAPADMNITAFRTVAGSALRLAFLKLSTETSQVGDFDCELAALFNPAGRPIYAASAGTDDYAFPSGFAVHVPAGQTVTLILDIVNDTTTSVTQNNQVLVQTAPASNVSTFAEMIMLGKSMFSIPGIPAGGTPGLPVQVAVESELLHDRQFLAASPIMRSHGIHQQLSLRSFASADAQEQISILLDSDFDPLRLQFHPLPMAVAKTGFPLEFPEAGIFLDCSYLNNGTVTIQFGSSSTDELCFSALYVFPSYDELSPAGLDGISF